MSSKTARRVQLSNCFCGRRFWDVLKIIVTPVDCETPTKCHFPSHIYTWRTSWTRCEHGCLALFTSRHGVCSACMHACGCEVLQPHTNHLGIHLRVSFIGFVTTRLCMTVGTCCTSTQVNEHTSDVVISKIKWHISPENLVSLEQSNYTPRCIWKVSATGLPRLEFSAIRG